MAFSFELDHYSRDFTIIETYIRQMADGVMRMTGIPLEEAVAYVKDQIKDIDFDKFVANFSYRGSNGDREIKSAPILKFLSTVESRNWTMSPSMTTYRKPDEQVSYVTAIIAEDQGKRDKVKKMAQTAKLSGDNDKAAIGTGMQNAIKFLVNSWSGAALSPSTPYYNPSMHPSLTSMCRISTALANAVAERMIAGKRFYENPKRVIESILVNNDTAPRSHVERALYIYGLVTPTVEQVMEVIDSSTQYYWEDAASRNFILRLVRTMDDVERANFVYGGDLYHLFKYNPEAIRTFLTDSSNSKSLSDTDKENCLKEVDSNMIMLISNLIGAEIKGTKIWDSIKDNPDIARLANNVADNILTLFEDKYLLLVETFLRFSAMPIDSAHQFNAIRKAVGLGDTDSAVFSTGPICELYYGTKGFSEAQEPVNDVVTYIINGSVAHALGHFTGQMDIPPDLRHLMEMKNEFKIPTLQLTPAGKTYHAYVKAEEGNVYSKPKWELKGSRLHAGRSNAKVTKNVHKWMMENKLKLNRGELIDRGELVDIILEVEKDLKDSLLRKDNVYFGVIKIKPLVEYGNPMGTEWGKHELYNIMFSDTHGKAPEPIYTAYKVSLAFPSGIKAWFNTLTPEYQARFTKWMELVGTTFAKPPSYVIVPTENFSIYGLPECLIPVVDLRKVALTTLDGAYLNLASLGINLDYDASKRGLLLSQIIEA